MATTTSLAGPPKAKSQPFLAILVGGLIVGALDFAYAFLVYSPHHPLRIAESIASGVLGAKSFHGGAATDALGIVLHFLIAFGAATVYFLASRKLKFMVSRAFLCGLIYGALVYFFMHLVVIRLSAAPHKGWLPLPYDVAEFVEHCFCVGLPIAVSVRRFAP